MCLKDKLGEIIKRIITTFIDLDLFRIRPRFVYDKSYDFSTWRDLSDYLQVFEKYEKRWPIYLSNTKLTK